MPLYERNYLEVVYLHDAPLTSQCIVNNRLGICGHCQQARFLSTLSFTLKLTVTSIGKASGYRGNEIWGFS